MNTSYLDLRPGWRLRVVTPLLRSGGYRLTPNVQQSGTNTMTVSAGKDFMGYETSYYLVRKKRWAGLGIQFLSAETTRNGVTRAELNPRVKLFQLQRRRRYIRLIYLRRASRSDHDMAVLAADDATVLADATAPVNGRFGVSQRKGIVLFLDTGRHCRHRRASAICECTGRMDFGALVFLRDESLVSDKPLHGEYIFGPCGHRRGRMMKCMRRAILARWVWTVLASASISVPGIHIFGSLGRRELKVQLLPTRQTTSSERGGNPRVRQAFGGQSPTPQHAAERRTSQETERKRHSALFPADCAPAD